MNDENQKKSSFVEHLTELRSRLVRSIIYLFLFFILCYFFAENIYNFLVEPYANAVKDDGLNRRMIFTALHETFITYLKVAFFAAMFISSPIILTQIWKFVAPGLYKNEKRALLPYLIATPTLFLLGGMLVYYLIMPLAIKFFLTFETENPWKIFLLYATITQQGGGVILFSYKNIIFRVFLLMAKLFFNEKRGQERF